jgi:hypothetical protein
MSPRFAHLASCFLEGTDVFVDHTGMLALHVAHLLSELFRVNFPLHDPLRRFSQFCIPLAHLLLETSNVFESELAILLRRSSTFLLFMENLGEGVDMFGLESELFVELRRYDQRLPTVC